MVKKVGEVEFNLNDLRITTQDGEIVNIETAEEILKRQIIEKFGAISRADNDATSKTKYEGRKNFKDFYNKHQKNTIDIWYKRPFYGKIAPHGLVSRIRPHGEVPSFVKRALDTAAKEYTRRELAKNNTIIPRLQIFKGVVSEYELHEENLNLIEESFVAKLKPLKYSSRIKNIDDFYEMFKEHIIELGLPYTIPGFMESSLNVSHTSGLVFDMHDGDPASDTEKIRWYEDPNFEVFSYILKEHGFKIDPNIPWRAIADLSSDKMWLFIRGRKAVPQTQISFALEEIPAGMPEYAGVSFAAVDLNVVYEKLFLPYADLGSFYEGALHDNSFVKNLTRIYYDFINSNPTYRIGDTRNSEFLKRRLYSVEPAHGPEIKWIKWYAEIRNIERGSPMSKKELESIVKRVNKIYAYALLNKKKEMQSLSTAAAAKHEEAYVKFAEIAIEYVEYTIGAIGINAAKVNKLLTIKRDDPILLLNL